MATVPGHSCRSTVSDGQDSVIERSTEGYEQEGVGPDVYDGYGLTTEYNAFKAPKLKIVHEAGTQMEPHRIEAYRREFCLPETSVFCGHFLCTLMKHGLMRRGHLMVFTNCIAFKSNVFGHYQRIIIDFRDVTVIRKTTRFRLPNTIVVTRKEGKELVDEVFTYFALKSRKTAFEVLVGQWARTNPAAAAVAVAQLAPAAAPADELEAEEEADGVPDCSSGGAAATHLPCLPQSASALPPTPDDMTLVSEMTFPDIDLDTFVQVLLSDASGFYPFVAKTEGHDPKHIGRWSAAPSPHAGVSSSCARTMQYMYVSKGPWGDVKCMSTIEQHATMFQGGMLLLENKQCMPDLPVVGKAFHVAFRWEVQQTAGSTGGACSTTAGASTSGAPAGSGWGATAAAASHANTAAGRVTGDVHSGTPAPGAGGAAGSGVDAPLTPNLASQSQLAGAWRELGVRSAGPSSSTPDAAASHPFASMKLSPPSGPSGFVETLAKAGREFSATLRAMGDDLKGVTSARSKSTTAAGSPRLGKSSSNRSLSLQRLKGSLHIRELKPSSSSRGRSSKAKSSDKASSHTKSLLSSESAEDHGWPARNAVSVISPRTSAAAAAFGLQGADGPELLSGVRSMSETAVGDRLAATGDAAIYPHTCLGPGSVGRDSTQSLASTASSNAAARLPSASDTAAAAAAAAASSAGGSEEGGELAAVSASTRSATLSVSSFFKTMRRMSDASSKLGSDTHSPRTATLVADSSSAEGSQGSSATLSALLPAVGSLGAWQHISAADSSSAAAAGRGTAGPAPPGEAAAAANTIRTSRASTPGPEFQPTPAAPVTPAAAAAATTDSSRSSTPPPPPAAAEAAPTTSSAAPGTATICNGSTSQDPTDSDVGSSSGLPSVTWKIYLAVRFSNKYHPLKGKVERGTFESVPRLYQQMLHLASEWLRHEDQRKSMAAVMPHLPPRGRHRRGPSFGHRRSGSILQRTGTLRNRFSNDDGLIQDVSAPAAAAKKLPMLLQQAVRRGVGLLRAGGHHLRLVQLRDVLLLCVLVVAVLQLVLWGRMLLLMQQLVDALQQQRP